MNTIPVPPVSAVLPQKKVWLVEVISVVFKTWKQRIQYSLTWGEE
jgi:hypothetical protein